MTIQKTSVNRVMLLTLMMLLMPNSLFFLSSIGEPTQYLIETESSVRAAADPNVFLSVWDTTNLGESASNQVKLPIYSSGTYDFSVNWGDDSEDIITSPVLSDMVHTYDAPGIYTIYITGTINGWRFDGGGDRLKILEIQQWGPLQLGNENSYFEGCENLNLSTTDILDLNGTSTLYEAFKGCTNLGSDGNLNAWNVSSVTNMSYMFYYAASFNQPLNAWDVSSVTDMRYMFSKSYDFNQPLDAWDVSSVTDMSRMFYVTSEFNQPLDAWDVSRVTDMSYMFYTSEFNQPLNEWDVSSVTKMKYMFYDIPFNHPLDAWDVSSVTDMSQMFMHAERFNQPLNAWDVSSVTSMREMFLWALNFNQPLNEWDVSSVTNMGRMFLYAYRFNQPLYKWDVSSVELMDYMFTLAGRFNQHLNLWDVSSVTVMSKMFWRASSFNQPLDAWDVSSVTDMTEMFRDISLSTSNYDDMLVSWSQLSLQSGVVFDAGNSQYSNGTAETARQLIIDTFGWTIIDGGRLPIVPDAPVLNVIEEPSPSGDVILTWNFVEEATNYIIYRSLSPITDVSGLPAIITGLLDTTYQDTVASNGTYYYVVVATNIAGNSPISNCESVVVAIDPYAVPPNAPVLSASEIPSSSGNITITWNSIVGATNYIIYRSTIPITEARVQFVLIYRITDLIYQDTGLSNGTYYYAVVATNDAGDSPISNCESVVVALFIDASTTPPEDDPTDDPSIPGFSLPILALCFGWAVVILYQDKNRKI